MKKILLFITAILAVNVCVAQRGVAYLTSALEIPFSLPTLDVYGGTSKGAVLRFAPFFNIQENFVYDAANSFGIFTGIAVRNVGFIYKIQDPSLIDPEFAITEIKKKFRTYNAAIPLGVKIGNFSKFFMYTGYEIEFPLHYKEKTFLDGKKIDKQTEWLSDKTPEYLHSFFIGVEFPYSINLKFKWYITQFFDKNCADVIPYIPNIEYNKFGVNVWYISLNCTMFKNTSFYFKKYMQRADEIYY